MVIYWTTRICVDVKSAGLIYFLTWFYPASTVQITNFHWNFQSQAGRVRYNLMVSNFSRGKQMLRSCMPWKINEALLQTWNLAGKRCGFWFSSRCQSQHQPVILYEGIRHRNSHALFYGSCLLARLLNNRNSSGRTFSIKTWKNRSSAPQSIVEPTYSLILLVVCYRGQIAAITNKLGNVY